MKEETLVEWIAKGIAKTMPGRLRYDIYFDLYQEGFIGLLAARKDFNPDKHVPFTAYAALRIRGAILDSLRESDWWSRKARKDYKQTGVMPATYITDEEIDFDRLVNNEADQLTNCIARQTRDRLRKEIDSLEPRLRMVLNLHYSDEI